MNISSSLQSIYTSRSESPSKNSLIHTKQPQNSHSGSTVDLSKINVCSICLDPLTDKHVYTLDACHHEYHSICLGKWLVTPVKSMIDAPDEPMNEDRFCPLCRQSIDFSQDDALKGFKKIIANYAALGRSVVRYKNFIGDMANFAASQYPGLTYVPREFWNQLPGLVDYLQFLEISKRCITKMLADISALELNVVATNPMGAGVLKKVNEVYEELHYIYDLLDDAQPYSVILNDKKELVAIDDCERFPTKIASLDLLNKELMPNIKALALEGLFTFYAIANDANRNNVAQTEQPLTNSN